MNPFLQEYKTVICSVQQGVGHYLVLLAETIFYPTGGGQPHDGGTINGIPIIDVFERDGEVWHTLGERIEEGEANCVLDWPRRLDHMQQHSGQHLLSAIFAECYAYHTESFHLGVDHCSIDLRTPQISAEELQLVEKRVNEVIFSNLPFLVYTVSPQEVCQIPIRKLPEVEGDLRIVEIEGLDYSPCAGTHVERTGQISLLKILRAENYKGMSRVYFLCGQRALRDYAAKHKICVNLGSLLSVPEAELLTRTKLELQKSRDLEDRVQTLQTTLLGYKAQELVQKGTAPFFVDLPEGSMEEGQQLARAILQLCSGVVVINLGERLVLTHNLTNSLHLGQLVKEYGQPLGGKGGGSATSSQVYFSEPEKLNDFLQIIKSSLGQTLSMQDI